MAGALAAGARDVGVIGTVTDEQQIATVDAATGAVKLVTPGADYVYEYAWSPDSASFACTYARGNGDNNWWVAKLATVPAASGARCTTMLAPKFQINDPHWSPDGTQIAIVGGLMSDFGPVGGDVYVVDAKTGDSRDVNAGCEIQRCGSALGRRPDRILLVAHVHGLAASARSRSANGSTTTLLAGNEESLRSVSIAKNGTDCARAHVVLQLRRKSGPVAQSLRQLRMPMRACRTSTAKRSR